MQVNTEKYILSKWHLLVILFSGTIVRFIYGYTSEAWLGAPDQLAWGLSLDEMWQSNNWSYMQLIHYPHEGGSLLMSLFSFFFRPLQFILPSLSLASLSLDIFSRYIQIKTTQRIWGNETALWFGTWTIVSVPLLIPWATVNFGLHAAATFFPFIFLHLINYYKEKKHLPVIAGIISGLAISFSYDSLVLVITSLLFFAFQRMEWKSKLITLSKFILAFILILLPHIILRIFFNSGFTLENNSVFSIRGIQWENLINLSHFTSLITIWYKLLPESIFLSSVPFLSEGWIRNIAFLFILSGVIYYLVNKTNNKYTQLLSLTIIFIFTFLYICSPFYVDKYNPRSFVVYRHLAYIIPLLIAILINGFISSGKLKKYLLIGWLMLCCTASIQYINFSKKNKAIPDYKAAGWVLAKKYGGNTSKLIQLYSIADLRNQDDILLGFGWGLTATLLENKNKNDTTAIGKLVYLIDQFPDQLRPHVIAGVNYSFGSKITPVLNKELQAIINYRLIKSK